MTRLTADDVRVLADELRSFEQDLSALTGLALRDVAMMAAAEPPSRAPLVGTRAAAVPISSGQGFIPGFCDCVVAILRHLGCEAWATAQPDVRGIQEAVSADADVLFMADDFRFIALNLHSGRCADNDPATANGYVAALEAAAGGLLGRHVLLLGLGPVGRAAARRLLARGAAVDVVEPDEDRLQAALGTGLALTPVALADGLGRCDLVFDATPAAGFIDAGDIAAGTIAAVPGLPSAFSAAAQELLGRRHIHEPLAIGVATMAATVVQ